MRSINEKLKNEKLKNEKLKKMRSIYEKLKKDSGVAGLNIIVSLVVMLFIIGLLVMVFSLMSGELMNSTDDATAVDVINKTGQSISSVTDWFDIFLVIGAMVVLILLVVIIIQAIRTSGVQAGAV